MIQQPIVSVIIPFLNAENFLEEAVESVLQQTYNHWELFLIDDGSSDGSTAIAQKYAKDYPEKIMYCEHENHMNKGVCASRNFGIEQSKGELIALLDSDDIWLPEKLKTQVRLLEEHPEAGMVCGAYEYWQSWQKDGKNDVVVPVGGPQDQLSRSPELLTHLYPLAGGAAPCPSDIIIRRLVYEQYAKFEAGIFVGDYQFYEDQAFFCKVYFNASVYISSQCLLRYRQHAQSLMALAQAGKNYEKARMFFLNWLEIYMKQHDFQYAAVMRAYKKAVFPYKYPLLFKLRKKTYYIIYPVYYRLKALKKRLNKI